MFWASLLGGIKPVTIALPRTYASTDAVAQKLQGTYENLSAIFSVSVGTDEVD